MWLCGAGRRKHCRAIAGWCANGRSGNAGSTRRRCGHALEESGGILLGLGVRCGHQQGCAGGGPARGLDCRAEQAEVTDALEAGRQDVLQEAGAEGGAIDEATNTPLMAELPPCTIGVPASSGHHGSTSQPQPSAARHPVRGKSGLATWHGLCVPSPRILTVWSASR